MNWWMNLYFAEGPGIPKDAPRPVGLRLLGQTLAREWWSLVLVNLITLAACLPLVTLPAALVALARVTTLIATDEPCEPWREFRDTFVARFRPATLAGLGVAAALALGGVAVKTYAQAAATAGLAYVVPLAIAAGVSLLTLVAAAYLAHLLANSRAPLGVLVKAAALATLLRPLPVVAALLANLGLWLLHVAAYPATILLAVTVNFSLGALFLSFATHKAAQIALTYALRPNTPRQAGA